MHDIAKAFLSDVCLSVKRKDCDKTTETCAHIVIPHERSFILVFWQEEWLLGGQPLLREILGLTDPVGAKMPIFNQYSLVPPQL